MPQEILTGGLIPATNNSQPQTQNPSPNPGESSDHSSQVAPETGQSQSPAPEITAENVFQAYDDYLTTGGATQSQQQIAAAGAQNRRALNSKRKFDNLSDEEAQLFNDMSTPAYDYLYPRHLKAREAENELKTLREQLSAQKDASFFDQENSWKVTPEYEALSSNLNSLVSERNFWEQQLGQVNSILAKAQRLAAKEDKDVNEILDGVTVDVLWNEGNGNITTRAVPVSYELAAKITAALNQSQNHIIDFQNKITSISSSHKEKHGNYIKTLNDLRTKMFGGYPADKLAAHSAKKLEMFPAHVRNHPEVKFLADAWVLFDALMHMLKQNRASGVSAQIKNNIAVNNGGAAAGGGGSPGSSADGSASDIIKQFTSAGYSIRGRSLSA